MNDLGGMPAYIGDWRIDLLETGRFALDGGSMFGSVPRVLWQELTSPDEAHRIPLALRLLLLRHRTQPRTVLVDTGMGNKFDDRFAGMFAVENRPTAAAETPVAAALRSVGCDPADVTDVILTHLHFDHAGGVSVREGDGVVPAFPDARHFLQRANLVTAEAPNPRERASYLRENVAPLHEVPLELLGGEEEVLPGIRMIPTQGHTSGMQAVRVEGGGSVLYYVADLAPTRHHIRVPFTMGYDLSPRDIMQEKSRLFAQAAEEQALIVFEHDPDLAAACIENRDGKFKITREIAARNTQEKLD